MAERSPLITGQRVRHRLRRRVGRALAAALRLGGIILLLAGAAAAVAAGVPWLLTSPHFAVAVVEVRGTSRLSPAEVREAAAIAPGENLFRLKSEEVGPDPALREDTQKHVKNQCNRRKGVRS